MNYEDIRDNLIKLFKSSGFRIYVRNKDEIEVIKIYNGKESHHIISRNNIIKYADNQQEYIDHINDKLQWIYGK